MIAARCGSCCTEDIELGWGSLGPVMAAPAWPLLGTSGQPAPPVNRVYRALCEQWKNNKN